jgi:hypothetical protein
VKVSLFKRVIWNMPVMISFAIALQVCSFAQQVGVVSAGPSTVSRSNHGAVLLPDGRVWLVGGDGASASTTTEYYTPSSGSVTAGFIAGPNLLGTQYAPLTVLLSTGKVLVAGNSNYTTDAELYDPSSGTVSKTGTTTYGHYRSSESELADGRVLLTGGISYSNKSELYDPATGVFTAGSNLQTGRANHASVLLADGRVLLVGGSGDATAELYDPARGIFMYTGNTTVSRSTPRAVLLNTGKVLVLGGTSDATAELYDPSTGVFTATGAMTVARSAPAVTLLTNGTVLVTGGNTSSAELYDPSTGVFTATTSMNASRTGHTATLLMDGSVLIVGGSGDTTAELYWPQSLTPAGLTAIGVVTQASASSANPTIRYIANGTMQGGTTVPLYSAQWSTGDSSIAAISNDVSSRGSLIRYTTGATTIKACAGSVCNSSQMQPSFRWTSPTTNIFNGTVLLQWYAAGGDASWTADIVIAGDDSYTIATGLPLSSSMKWDSTVVDDGHYELLIITRDKSGNQVGEAVRTVLINNSAEMHSGTTATSETWSSGEVQIISGNVIIPSGATVTIQPGVIVKAAQNTQIIVEPGGILNALGTSTSPIILTVMEDDSVGGDTNMDGTTSHPYAGEWGGVYVPTGGQFNFNQFTSIKYAASLSPGSITADTTWFGTSLYQITSKLTISSGATLTIQPGTVVKFGVGSGIVVQTGGQLVATGTAAQPIYFTSVKDDSIGGDTNGDGNSSAPAAGDWGGIIANGGAANLDHISVVSG